MSSIKALVKEVEAAHQKIEPYVRQTRLQHSPFYSGQTGANVYFKCENLQHSGSFKLRGAANTYLSLTLDERRKGVVAASTGNHGKAVAYIANLFAGDTDIFAPENADDSKLDSIRNLGAQVHLVGSDCIEAEAAARAFADKNGSTYISPYNDTRVMAGQGTMGFELCQQLDQIDALFASVGGGGMIGGAATYVKSRFPNCEIVGCSPENSKVMFESLAAGKLLDSPSKKTFSDGTAGGIEHDSITFEVCRDIIDTCVTVSEFEIAKRLVEFIVQHSMLIEGSAAVAIAALIKTGSRFAGKNIVVVLCGANISPQRLKEVITTSSSND